MTQLPDTPPPSEPLTDSSTRSSTPSSSASPDQASVNQASSQTGTGPEASAFKSEAPSSKKVVPFWVRLAPFVFSAVLFLSAVFSIFAPLPILMARLRAGRAQAFLALLTNSAIVFFVAGGASAYFYLTLLMVPIWVLGEMLSRGSRLVRSDEDGSVQGIRTLSLEKSALFAMIGGLVFGAVVFAGYSLVLKLSPLAHLKQHVQTFVDLVFNAIPAPDADWRSSPEGEAMRESLLVEFPSGVLIFMLLSVWANLLLVLRVNPAQLRLRLGRKAGVWREWKAPEHLVWPTIVCGAGLLGDFGVFSQVAINGFRVLMAIYALQGLSILSFFFDVWRVSGIFRSLAYLMALMLMLPLVLALGFFDLWFDFRAKFRQSL